MAFDRVRFDIGDRKLVPMEEASSIEVAAFHARNRDRFAPYSPMRTEFYYTAAYWDKAKSRSKKERKIETALRWVLIDANGVYAQVSLDQVTFGILQCASLGYVLDTELENQGIMTQCLTRVIKHAFEVINLHRVVANHVPENEKSAGVLSRLGFEREGYAKSYLQLNGVWRDHVLNALVNPAQK